MGAKNSKSELNRSKSFSTFGRSSQRSLFQKSKLGLNQINKKILKSDTINHEEIKTQLERIEKDLSGISPAVKEKNKQKYEDALKYFQETKLKFEERIKPQEQDVQEEQPKLEGQPQIVELKVITVSTENLDEIDKNDIKKEENVEIRKPSQPVAKISVVNEIPNNPKIKFGIQVMPLNPRVSQEVLKRNTLPVNEIPKQEFQQIRNTYDSEVPSLEERERVESDISNPSSPQTNKKVELEALVKRKVDGKALETIESITKEVDVLENSLKYFKGKKWDNKYMELHKELVNNLIKLDSVPVQGDSVIKQERKIVTKRIQELIKILECLGEQKSDSDEDSSGSDNRESLNEKNVKHEEIINLEGKPVTATAI